MGEEFNIDLRADDFPALPSKGNKINEAQLEIPSQSRSEEWFRPWVEAVTQSIPCSDNEKLQKDQGLAAVMTKTYSSRPSYRQNFRTSFPHSLPGIRSLLHCR